MFQLPDFSDDKPKKTRMHQNKPKLILINEKQWYFVQNKYDLTPRERQIAELICQGLQNGNIAKHLRIRPGTVKTHTRNIYRKVRVKSKIAMLLRFVEDVKEFPNHYIHGRSYPITD